MHVLQFVPFSSPNDAVDTLLGTIDLDSLDSMARKGVEREATLVKYMNQNAIESYRLICQKASKRLLLATVVFIANAIILWIHNKRLKRDRLAPAP